MPENKCTQCCCTCDHQRKLTKHPSNTEFGKGPMNEFCGYVCTMWFNDGSNEGHATYFDGQHGICEMWTGRTWGLLK